MQNISIELTPSAAWHPRRLRQAGSEPENGGKFKQSAETAEQPADREHAGGGAEQIRSRGASGVRRC